MVNLFGKRVKELFHSLLKRLMYMIFFLFRNLTLISQICDNFYKLSYLKIINTRINSSGILFIIKQNQFCFSEASSVVNRCDGAMVRASFKVGRLRVHFPSHS